jgi:hypothetical protein
MRALRRFVILVTALALTAPGCATSTRAGSVPPPLPSRHALKDPNGFYFQPAGLSDDYPEETASVAQIKKDLAILQKLGVHYLRVGIGWDGIEEKPGVYHWRHWDDLFELAPKYGVTLLPYVCYTPRWLSDDPTDFWREPPSDLSAFGKFMRVIATHYRGKVRSWELWNEPDLENYWLGTPAQFARMIDGAARAVHQADPSVRVVLGGFSRGDSPFSETLLRKYHVGSMVDVINVHGYLETWSPERTESYPKRLQKMADLIHATSPSDDLWLAEFGYSDWRYSDNQASLWGIDVLYDYEHTPEYQAVTLWKDHVLATASQDVSLTTWYRLHDLPKTDAVIGDDNNKHLGILDIDGKPKPAYDALAVFTQVFDEPIRRVTARVKVHKSSKSQSVLEVFEKKSGDLIVTAWLRSSKPSEVADRSGYAHDSRRETVSVTLPRGFLPAGVQVETFRGNPPAPAPRLHGNRLTGIHLRGDGVSIIELNARKSHQAPAAPQ